MNDCVSSQRTKPSRRSHLSPRLPTAVLALSLLCPVALFAQPQLPKIDPAQDPLGSLSEVRSVAKGVREQQGQRNGSQPNGTPTPSHRTRAERARARRKSEVITRHMAKELSSSRPKGAPPSSELAFQEFTVQFAKERALREEAVAVLEAKAAARDQLPQEVIGVVRSSKDLNALPFQAKEAILRRMHAQLSAGRPTVRRPASAAARQRQELIKEIVRRTQPCTKSSSVVVAQPPPGARLAGGGPTDILFYRREMLPFDVDLGELFGDTVQAYSLSEKKADPELTFAITSGGIDCLPTRLRYVQGVYVRHEGEDAIKRYSDHPHDKGILDDRLRGRVR